VAAGAHPDLGRGDFVEVFLDQGDEQGPAAFPHGLEGIGAQVHENLMELGGIGLADDRPRRRLHRDADVAGQGGRDEPHGLGHDVHHVDGLKAGLGGPGKGQDLLDQPAAALPGPQHALEIRLHGIVRGKPQHGQFGGVDDRGENIVEIVGDAAGQGADSFHLLGLEELAFQAYLLGHVLGRGEHADHETALVVQGNLLDFQQHVHSPDIAGGEFAGDGAVAAHDVHVGGAHGIHVFLAQRQGKVIVSPQIVQLGKAEKVEKGPVGSEIA